MFDSRSDHPHKGLHLGRWYADKPTGGDIGVDNGGGSLSVRRRRGDALAIAEGVVDLTEVETFEPIDCEADYAPVQFNRWEIAAAHGEALRYNGMAAWERELLLPWTDPEGNVHEGEGVDWFDEMEQARQDLEMEQREIDDAEFDAAYGGYSDDPDCGDHSGCWMPYMRMDEVRDTFGHNWAGNGFHIISPNARRTK